MLIASTYWALATSYTLSWDFVRVHGPGKAFQTKLDWLPATESAELLSIWCQFTELLFDMMSSSSTEGLYNKYTMFITNRGAPASTARMLSQVFIKGYGLLYESRGRICCLALEPRAAALLPNNCFVLILWILNLVTNQSFLWVVAKKNPRKPHICGPIVNTITNHYDLFYWTHLYFVHFSVSSIFKFLFVYLCKLPYIFCGTRQRMDRWMAG